MYYCDYAATGIGTNYDPAQGSVNPYTKNSQMFVCPSDASGQKNSYSLNNLVVPTQDTNSKLYQGIALASFRGSANTILFAEEQSGGKGTNDGFFIVPTQGAWVNDNTDATTAIKGNDAGVDASNAPTVNSPIRHSGGACYALADGHSKWFKPSQIKPVFTSGTSYDISHHEANAPRWEP